MSDYDRTARRPFPPDLRRAAMVLHASALVVAVIVALLWQTDSRIATVSAAEVRFHVTGTEDSSPEFAAPSGQMLLAWGAGGHYWAVYFVALLAGYSREEAWKIAFLSWMPDQVQELDAAWLFMRTWSRRTGRAIEQPIMGYGRHGQPIVIQQRDQASDWLNLELPTLRGHSAGGYRNLIHRGLHCLTGSDAMSETRYRMERSRAAATNGATRLSSGRHGLLFGLSIHPFGDSFAHRNTNERDIHRQTMYPTGRGHGIEALSNDVPELNPEWFRSHGGGDWGIENLELRGHAPDHLDFRPDITIFYVVSLYRLFMETSGAREPRIPNRLFSQWPTSVGHGNGVISVTPYHVGLFLAWHYAAGILARAPDDLEAGAATVDFSILLWGAGLMRGISDSIVVRSNTGYDPHREAIPWRDFIATNPGAREFGETGLQLNDLEDLLVGVERWADEHP